MRIKPMVSFSITNLDKLLEASWLDHNRKLPCGESSRSRMFKKRLKKMHKDFMIRVEINRLETNNPPTPSNLENKTKREG